MTCMFRIFDAIFENYFRLNKVFKLIEREKKQINAIESFILLQ